MNDNGHVTTVPDQIFTCGGLLREARLHHAPQGAWGPERLCAPLRPLKGSGVEEELGAEQRRQIWFTLLF